MKPEASEKKNHLSQVFKKQEVQHYVLDFQLQCQLEKYQTTLLVYRNSYITKILTENGILQSSNVHTSKLMNYGKKILTMMLHFQTLSQ